MRTNSPQSAALYYQFFTPPWFITKRCLESLAALRRCFGFVNNYFNTMKTFNYDSLTNGQTIHLDKAQRALVFTKYGDHASDTYVVFDKGRLRPQTVVHTYIHEYYDENGVFIRKETETIKETLGTKPLVLVGGVGRLKKVTLLWEDIEAFTYDDSKASDYKATKTRTRKSRDEITICTKGLSPEQLELLRKLGVQV